MKKKEKTFLFEKKTEKFLSGTSKFLKFRSYFPTDKESRIYREILLCYYKYGSTCNNKELKKSCTEETGLSLYKIERYLKNLKDISRKLTNVSTNNIRVALRELVSYIDRNIDVTEKH